MQNRKLKYAMLTTEAADNLTAAAMASVGFHQWLNVFDGQILAAGQVLPHLTDGEFDILHIRPAKNNLALARTVREKLGKQASTKLVVSVDMPCQSWQACGLNESELRGEILAADLAFGTEYTIAQAMEKLSGKACYELPHPADIEKLKSSGSAGTKREYLAVLGRIRNRRQLMTIQKSAGIFGLKARSIHGYEATCETGEGFRQNRGGIEQIYCRDEEEFLSRLKENKLVISLYEYPDYGKEVIYAAALGCMVIGYPYLDVIRRCFPYTSLKRLKFLKLLGYFYWFQGDPGALDYMLQNARFRVEYYNWGNSRKRLLDALFLQTGDQRFCYQKEQREREKGLTIFIDEMKHLHGKRHNRYGTNDFTVVCLVKNGMDYLPAFLPYYRRLGAKHCFFIDNGSTDGTIRYLSQFDDVTVYETKLLHKEYENEIRRSIIEEHCRNSWCLYVDIDEFFDYPFSDRLGMDRLLAYLNENGFTAVIAYMLDMFPRELVFTAGHKQADFQEECCYYDISDVQKKAYYFSAEIEAYAGYNRLADKKMVYYYGGIRRKEFKDKLGQFSLIKHPLTFGDHKIQPASTPHFCNKAAVADINGVLKHYKFLPAFQKNVIACVETNTHMYFTDREYRAYYEAVKNKNQLNLFSPRARVYNLTNLIEQKFIRVSPQFRHYASSVNAKE